MKRSLNKFLKTSRFAVRKDVIENLATTFLDWEEYRTDSGDLAMKQVMERRDDGIAVIHVDGALAHRNSFEAVWFGEDTYQAIGDAFDEALADIAVQGIVFEIDSPGGVVNGVSDLASKIFGARGSKPLGIVSHTAGDMCSAAYWIGSACERVYTSDNASLGSIGTLCVFRKSKDEKIDVIRSTLSPNKAPSPDSAEGRSLIEKELDDIASVFISTVAAHRGVDYATVVSDFGQGACFVGKKAVDAGLADAVKSLDEVIADMKITQSNGGSMPNANKSAEALDVEAQKKEAVEAERARIKGINAVFAGLGLEADAQSFIDDGKSVAEAKDFAFDKVRAALEESRKEVAALKAGAPATVTANEETKKAIDLLEQANAESKKIVGGESEPGAEDKAINAGLEAAFAAGAASRVKKGA